MSPVYRTCKMVLWPPSYCLNRNAQNPKFRPGADNHYLTYKIMASLSGQLFPSLLTAFQIIKMRKLLSLLPPVSPNPHHNKTNTCLIVWGPKANLGLNLALASIQCFIVDSIAPESPDSKSARCKAVTLRKI